MYVKKKQCPFGKRALQVNTHIKICGVACDKNALIITLTTFLEYKTAKRTVQAFNRLHNQMQYKQACTKAKCVLTKTPLFYFLRY